MAETVLLGNVFTTFFEYLQQQGYIVAISQKIAFFNSIKHLGILDKEIFLSICRTTLASDYSHLLRLDFYLNIYFDEKNILGDNFRDISLFFKNKKDSDNLFLKDKKDSDNSSLENKNSVLTEKKIFETETAPIEGVVSRYMFQQKNYGALLKYIVLDQKEQLMRLIHLSAQNIDYAQLKNSFGTGKVTEIIRKRLGTEKLPELFDKFIASLKESGASDEEIEHISKRIKRGLQTLKKNIRNYVKLKVDSIDSEKYYNRDINIINNSIKDKNIDFYEKNINTINYKESSQEMSDALTQLIEKLKRKKGIKQKKDRKGRVDIKKIIKKSAQTELIPFKIYFKKKVMKKNSVIFFCDISESVQKTTYFILKFILLLKERFDKMRGFVFISESGDITDYFENSSIDNAIAKIISSPPISTNINSNYSTAFEHFIKNFEHYLTPSTLFFIVGDGRGNYDSNALSSIIYLKKKVKKIVWLNPEESQFWGLSDSDMSIYLQHVDSAYPLYNMKTLEKFAIEFSLV